MRGLKFISWGDTTGYAVAAKAYVRALVDAGVNLTWAPMLSGRRAYEPYLSRDWPCPQLASVCNRVIDYDTVVIHTVPEYYPDWIEVERKPGRRVLGYTVWELERLPDHWPAILNRLDGVIVPCHWNVEVFRNSGVHVPIHVVPHLSQFEYLDPVTDADRAAIRWRLGAESAAPGRFTFNTVGFWSNRKAPYLALEAYLRAFSAADPVQLVIKTSTNDITRSHRHWRNGFRRRHPSPRVAVEQLLSRHPAPPAVSVIADESLSDAQMLALHAMGDGFVSLTRTEGWGLGAFEAARLGQPVVMTGYGGQLDFLDPELAYLVDYRMVPVHEPTWSANYRSTDEWAEPSVEHAAALLREVFERRDEARARAARLAQRIARDFSREAVTGALLRALQAEASV